MKDVKNKACMQADRPRVASLSSITAQFCVKKPNKTNKGFPPKYSSQR